MLKMGSGSSTPSAVVFPEEAAIKTVIAKKEPFPTPRGEKGNVTDNGGTGSSKERSRKRQKINSSSEELMIKRANINVVSMLSYKRWKNRQQNGIGVSGEDNVDKSNSEMEKKALPGDNKEVNNCESKHNDGGQVTFAEEKNVIGRDTDADTDIDGDDMSNEADELTTDDEVISEHSDDTMFAAGKIPILMKQNFGESDSSSEAESPGNKNDINDPKSVRREKTDTDFIKLIAQENNNDPNNYDVDTIGYYIARSSNEPEGIESGRSVTFLKDEIRNALFDDLKRREAEREESQQDQNPKRPVVAVTRQTLVLRKVGWRYKYVTVPAYLPGQRLVPISRSFRVKTVSMQNGRNTSAPSQGVDDKESPGSDTSKKKVTRKGSTLKATKLPSCSLPSNMTPTFYVGGGNGVSLVESALNNMGWKRTTDKYDDRFKLKWVECKTRINYGNFKEGEQLVNHLPNSHLLTNKLGLLNSLKEYERVTLSTKGRLPRLKMIDFIPETYKLDEKADRDQFLEIYQEGEIWICKPVGMNQGKGIFLIRSREAIDQLLEEREQKKQSTQKPGRPLMNRIVQRYIKNPLLLDGRKFDVRAYMLIASTVPFLILYHKGYVRLTCMKYDPDDTNLGIHLTNQFVQKKDPLYKEIKEDTAWSMDKFNDYINEHVRPNSHIEIEENWVYNGFTKQMQKIMIHCFNSVKHKLQARVGFFDLFGLDFMVDTDMKVSLIEVNTNPALHCNCEALKEVIPGVVEESLYVAIECFEKSRKNQQLMPLQSLKSFTILYCGTRANTIIPRQSRSISPSKENSSEKVSRPAAVGNRRPGSPSRGNPRSSTQSTQIQPAAATRRMSEKGEAATSKSASATTSSANVKSAPASKSKVKDEKSDGKPDGNTDNGENLAKANSVENEPKSKSGTVVIDTLSKTTDSLNQATNTLGKLTSQLNQVGLTDTLLEEVRLKMTHAEAGSPIPVVKPKSATPTRERENLERGN